MKILSYNINDSKQWKLDFPRLLKNGNRSIYLDFYEKGKRWNEYLNLFLIPEDAPAAKRLNEAAMAKANETKSKRLLGIEDEMETDDGKQTKLPKRIFAEWLDEHIEGVRRNPSYLEGTYHNYRSATLIIKAYLKHRRRPRFMMSDIDKKFIVGLLDFMKNTYRNTKSPDNPKEMSLYTLHLHQSTLVRMLNAAVKEGVMDRNLSTHWRSTSVLPSNSRKGITLPKRNWLRSPKLRQATR